MCCTPSPNYITVVCCPQVPTAKRGFPGASDKGQWYCTPLETVVLEEPALQVSLESSLSVQMRPLIL
jgi:hypothetical protein